MASETRRSLCTAFSCSYLDLETANQLFPKDVYHQISFTPTINGKHPDPRSTLVCRINFLAKQTFIDYLHLLEKDGHFKHNAEDTHTHTPPVAALPERRPGPTSYYPTTGFNPNEPERVIRSFILIATINNEPILKSEEYTFACDIPHKAWLYTKAIREANDRFLRRQGIHNPIESHSQPSRASAPHATHSASARTRARAPAAAAAADNPAPAAAAAADNIGRAAHQQSRKKPMPATAHTSSSAHSSVPAAAAAANIGRAAHQQSRKKPMPATAHTSSSAHSSVPAAAAAADNIGRAAHQQSRKKPMPATAHTSSSAHSSVPAAAAAVASPAPDPTVTAYASSNGETLYTPPYDYSMDMLVDESSKYLVVFEKWHIKDPSPNRLPNAISVTEDIKGEYLYRISHIPKDQIELVVERILERFDEGLMKIEERWPVGQATPPKPRGHKETLSLKREDDFMIRQSLCRRHAEPPDSKETQPSS